ncbi:sugar transferase [Candidatus Saccharibacteria bacterium]|nr:sugar transferase [Candidatus Saccharibacteria bacterium]MBR0467885.1 sugar transferase [Candidatus Saccharibacteria bacterium]
MPRKVVADSVRQESLRLQPKYNLLSTQTVRRWHELHFRVYGVVKRGLDLVFAAVMLVAFLPLFLIVAVAIKIDSPGPVFFRQKRTGLSGREFEILKFRSMAFDNDARDASCADKYTRVGKVIRRISVDELPQLLNVLIGQMSFIGPRPWVPEYFENMNERERGRVKVRPGITGLAAARGRNGLSVTERIEYDLWYIEHYSLWQDVKVVVLTLKTVVSGADVNAGKTGIHGDIEVLRRKNRREEPPFSPLVSVVMPVHNAEKYVGEAIQSVFDQTYQNWELIVVDDASSDGSSEVVSKFLSSDRVKLVCLPENGGAAKARNCGVREAQGELICFIDADDLWVKDKLSKQVAFMKKTGAAFAFGSYVFADASGRPNGKVVRVPATITYKQALKNTTIWTSTVMFDMRKLSRRDIEMPDVVSEDTATWWKVLKMVGEAYGLDDVVAIYRRGGKTLSSNKAVAVKRIWWLYRKFEELNLPYSVLNFTGYAFNAVRRRV